MYAVLLKQFGCVESTQRFQSTTTSPPSHTLTQQSFKNAFIKTLPLGGVAMLYLVVRFLTYPVTATTGSTIITSTASHLLSSFKHRFFELVTLLADLSNTSLIPPGNRIFKGAVMVLFATAVVYLFVKSRHKKITLSLLLCTAFYLWPALRSYQPRYFYFALPFFILMLLILIKEKVHTTKIVVIFCSLMLGVNAFVVVRTMNTRQQTLHMTTQAFDQLCRNEALANHTLCFIALPYKHFVCSVAQAVWMRGVNTTLPIYYDIATFTHSDHEISHNDFELWPIKNGFRLRSRHNKVWWLTWRGNRMPMGQKIIHTSSPTDGKVYDMTYKFDKKLWNKNMLFVSWDYDCKKFKILHHSLR